MEREEKIRVAVRAKPYPRSSNAADSPENQETIVLSPDGSAVYVYTDEQRNKAASFQCDTFLSPSMHQNEVFDAIQAPQLIEAALDGFPVTIFAYGQTGAGKSFTIFGKEDGVSEKKPISSALLASDGVLPRIAVELMRIVDARKLEMEYTLRITCVEIYNEQVRDVFDPRKENLSVRSSKEHGFFLENATVVQCASAQEIIRVVKTAAANRTKSSHLLNERSNRSHCLVTIYIDSMPLDGGNGGGVKKYGKLTIVDLAGSERVNDTGAVGAQLKETGHINKSLYCLNQVIQALNSKAKSKFVPVRDSKLTMLLIDSLGGNSKTLMIACVNSAPQFCTESIRTLEFAMGVAKIKNRPTAVLSPHEKLIMDLKEQIRLLKLENMMLRSRTPGYFLDHPRDQMAPEDYDEQCQQRNGVDVAMSPLGKALLTDRRQRRIAADENQESHDKRIGSGGGGGGGGFVSKLNATLYQQRTTAVMPTQRQSKSSGEVQSSLQILKKKQLKRTKAVVSSPKKKLVKKKSSMVSESYALPPVRQFLAPRPFSSQTQTQRQPMASPATRPASPPPEYDDLFFGVETVPIPVSKASSLSKIVLPSASQHELHHKSRDQLRAARATPPPEYSLSLEEQLQRLFQQMIPQQPKPSNKPKLKAQMPQTLQPRSMLRSPDSSSNICNNSSAPNDSIEWDDDRAQQLFQQLCNLK